MSAKWVCTHFVYNTISAASWILLRFSCLFTLLHAAVHTQFRCSASLPRSASTQPAFSTSEIESRDHIALKKCSLLNVAPHHLDRLVSGLGHDVALVLPGCRRGG